MLSCILNIRLLFFIFTVANAANNSDQCINILNRWDLRQGMENKCPNWVVDVRWIIYDVKDGEGFNLQRNVFDRMALVVSSLNEIMYKKKRG